MRRSIICLAVGFVALPPPLLAGTTTTYTYDALGRLVQANTTGTINNGVAMTTSYDPADNRTSYVVTGSVNKVVVVPLNGLTVIPIPDN